MKAATPNKVCFPGQDGALRAMPAGRALHCHAPRRHVVGVRSAPRLTDPLPVVALAVRKGGSEGGVDAPRVLHIDADGAAASALASLLTPEACVIHVSTLAEARHLLQTELFSLVVLDPTLPDGDGATLLPALAATPLLVYAERQPHWPAQQGVYLAKPWTTPRVLFSTISKMLGIAPFATAGD